MDLEASPFITLDHAEPCTDQESDWTWPEEDTFTDDSIARRTIQTFEAGSPVTLDHAEPIPDQDLDLDRTWPAVYTSTDDSITSDHAKPSPDRDLNWTWPAADTFTDDSIARRTLQTCSGLGSQRIRLIKIRSGSSNAMLRCDTKVCFLSQAGDYTALSYTWGCPVERCQIIVDAQPRRVTVNLWRFLWQARQLPAQFSGWLWIDALSIEQSDPWEKLEQVKIISSIFRSAAQVFIWLGPAYHNSDKAMKALTAQKTKSPRWRTARSLWASPVGPAMLEMCERPYWHRLWVYQEMRASQTPYMLCGSKFVSLEPLKSLLQYSNADERIEARVRNLKDSPAAKMVNLGHGSSETYLRTMLDATNHLRCTDPRDRVYAILNTVSGGHEGIEADYTMSLPELVNRVLRNMHDIIQPNNLEIVGAQCRGLEEIFHMRPGSIYATDKEALAACSDPLERLWTATRKTFLEQNIDLVLQDVHAWCKRYNHVAVGQAVRRYLPGHWMMWKPDDVLNLNVQRRELGYDTAENRMHIAIALAYKSFDSFFEEKDIPRWSFSLSAS